MVQGGAGKSGTPNVSLGRANFPGVDTTLPDATRGMRIIGAGVENLADSLAKNFGDMQDRDTRRAMVQEEAKFLDEMRKIGVQADSMHDSIALPDTEGRGGVINYVTDEVQKVREKFSGKFQGAYEDAFQKMLESHATVQKNQAATLEAKEREVYTSRVAKDYLQQAVLDIDWKKGDPGAVSLAVQNAKDRMLALYPDRPEKQREMVGLALQGIGEAAILSSLDTNPAQSRGHLDFFTPYMDPVRARTLAGQVKQGEQDFEVKRVRGVLDAIPAANLEQRLAYVQKNTTDPDVRKRLEGDVVHDFHMQETLKKRGEEERSNAAILELMRAENPAKYEVPRTIPLKDQIALESLKDRRVRGVDRIADKDAVLAFWADPSGYDLRANAHLLGHKFEEYAEKQVQARKGEMKAEDVLKQQAFTAADKDFKAMFKVPEGEAGKKKWGERREQYLTVLDSRLSSGEVKTMDDARRVIREELQAGYIEKDWWFDKSAPKFEAAGQPWYPAVPEDVRRNIEAKLKADGIAVTDKAVQEVYLHNKERMGWR